MPRSSLLFFLILCIAIFITSTQAHKQPRRFWRNYPDSEDVDAPSSSPSYDIPDFSPPQSDNDNDGNNNDRDNVPDFTDDWPAIPDVATTLENSAPTPSPEIIRLGPSPGENDRAGVEGNQPTTADGSAGPRRRNWVVLSITMGVIGFIYL